MNDYRKSGADESVSDHLDLESVRRHREYVERVAEAAYMAFIRHRAEQLLLKQEEIPPFETLTENVKHGWQKVVFKVEDEILKGP